MEEKEKSAVDAYAKQQYISDYRISLNFIKLKKQDKKISYAVTTTLPMPESDEFLKSCTPYWLYYYSLIDENRIKLENDFDRGLLSCYGTGDNSLRRLSGMSNIQAQQTILHALFGGEKPDFKHLRDKIYPWAVQHIWELLDIYFESHKKEIPDEEFNFLKNELKRAQDSIYLKELGDVSIFQPPHLSKPKGNNKSNKRIKADLESKEAEIEKLKRQLEDSQKENDRLKKELSELKRVIEGLEKSCNDRQSNIDNLSSELKTVREIAKQKNSELEENKRENEQKIIEEKETILQQILNSVKEPLYEWQRSLSGAGEKDHARSVWLKKILASLSEIGIGTIVQLDDLLTMRTFAFDEKLHYDDNAVYQNGQPVYAITLGFKLYKDNSFGLSERVLDKAEVMLNDKIIGSDKDDAQ